MQLLDVSLCREAILTVQDLVKTFMVEDKRDAVAVVIADPLCIPGSINRTQWMYHGGILLREYFGDESKCETRYSVFASHKAWLSWQHRLSTRVIQEERPYLLEKDDLLYYGSVYYEGIVVATSGLTQEHDEEVSTFTAKRLVELSRAKRSKLDPNVSAFLQ
jgi:hypothetical protein